MIVGFDIRLSTPGDVEAIERLYGDAFPNEDLLPLVRDLLTCQHRVLSLVGTAHSSMIAHVAFTNCHIDECGLDVALLAPLAVAPAWQRKGIGSLMVREGLRRMENDGIRQVFVLGDPVYYGRFGFSPETRITPPYSLPAEWLSAWQSTRLGDAEALSAGTLRTPAPWRRKELWSP